MIFNTSVLIVCDNSGVVFVKCFKVTKQISASIGTVVYTSVKLRKNKTKLQKVTIVKGIIVRLIKNMSRKTGIFIAFSLNEIVLFSNKNEPLGTRIFGPLPLELRKKNYLKLLSLASIFV